MMADIYENYRKLRKNAFRSYWEKRILSEIGYLIELLYEKEIPERGLMEQAMDLLMKDYCENEQICVRTAREAEQILLPLSERAKKITMVCVAHAHIDMNWMWGYQETVSIILDTVRTMLTLMKEYPKFRFAQSQAAIYNILEEYEPGLLKEVKQRVKEGRWEVTASTWVENDKNIPNGESMVRQILYTKKYLSKLLDIKEEALNIDFEPDTFGHSFNLPEILWNGGVTRYYHLRGYDENKVYRWKGMSGKEILVYCGAEHYNAWIDSTFYEGVPAFCKKYGIHKILYVYGVGDHGGGPTRRDIERLMDMDTWPLYPSVQFGTYKEYFDYLEKRKEQLPVAKQELNYVFTGCYTSQARIKMANRIGEARLTEAEILESMAKLKIPEYQRIENLESAWRKILFNQFHDIVPGSGTIETREYAMGKFQEAMARAGANGVHAMEAICDDIADSSEEKADNDTVMGAGVGLGTDYASGYGFSVLGRGSGPTRYLALFNVTQVPRTESTEITLWDWQEDIENIRITDMDGQEYPFQFLEKGDYWNGYWGHSYCKLLVWMPVPAAGYTVCCVKVRERGSISRCRKFDWRPDNITDEPICLENDKVKAVFDVPTMKCISFVRKRDGKEVITSAKPACGLTLITEETSNGMSAWRVGKTANILDLNESCYVKPGKIQTEGLRKELEYEIIRENLKIHVKIRLDKDSEFLDYRLETVWTMLGSEKTGVPQLRFQVPCGYEVAKYRYTIPYAVLERPPLAQDVPAIGLGCAMPRSGGSALYMMSDCKYGFRGDHEGLSLNLIRGSYYPDPYPDIGEHIIRIAVGACEPEEDNLALMAERYIHPIIVRSCAARPRKESASKSLFGLEGAVLSAVKEAEDGNGFIVRVYNPFGKEKTMRLYLPGRKVEAYLCDFLENDKKPVVVENEKNVIYTLDSYEVVSLRVILK